MYCDSTCRFIKRDHYFHTTLHEWNFVKANVSKVQADGNTYLAGNLQLYSPDSKEPGKPMYLSIRSVSALQKVASAVEVATTEPSDIKTDPMIYPNPMGKELNLSFYLEKETVCRVEIYSINGTKVYDEQLGNLPSGAQHFRMLLNLYPGNYMVKLHYGNKVFTNMLIKK